MKKKPVRSTQLFLKKNAAILNCNYASHKKAPAILFCKALLLLLMLPASHAVTKLALLALQEHTQAEKKNCICFPPCIAESKAGSLQPKHCFCCYVSWKLAMRSVAAAMQKQNEETLAFLIRKEKQC